MTKAQKQKALKELSEAITVRNHIMTILNGQRNVIKEKAHVKVLTNFVTEIDQEVVNRVVSFNAPDAPPQPTKKDLDMAAARTQMKAEKKAATQPPVEKKTAAEKKAPAAEPKKAKAPAKPQKKGVVRRVLD